MALSVLAIVIVVSSCATDEREWMKIDQKYTTAEFRRDLAECTTKGKLDEECKKEDPLSQPYGRGGPRR
jgi:hypothetical protein